MPNPNEKPGWLLKPISALLLDITGVLYESGNTTAIKGSVEAIQRLRKAGIPFRLVTNETTNPTPDLIKKLVAFGFDFNTKEIITPAMISRQYLAKHNLRPLLLIDPKLEPEFASCERKNPNCVLIGDANKSFTYEAMNRAFQLLMSLKTNHSQDHLLLSMGINKYYRDSGKLVLDLGPFTVGLEYATDLKAVVIGKPDPKYFQSAIDSFEKPPPKDHVVMIGDDIMGDVKGAQDFGIRGVLVRTGKYLPQNENHPIVKPDAIVDNLAQAIDLILKHQT